MRIIDWSSDACSSDLWREGVLVVNDERHREHIASVLQAAGFPVSGSLAVDPFDLRGVWRYGGLEIQARRPDEGEGLLLRAADRSHEMVARYDSTTRILWVQDIRIEQVVRAYAERVGDRKSTSLNSSH